MKQTTNMKKYLIAFVCCLSLFTNPVSILAIGIESVLCEFRENPLGVDSENPRLSWILTSAIKGDKQTGYEIWVATTPELLTTGNPDMWNSGKVSSGQSQYIEYGGKPLKCGEQYYWKVRVWDLNGNSSGWSAVNTWSMALDENHWSGQWIGAIDRENSNLPVGNIYHTPGLKKELAELWNNVDPLAKKSIMLRKEFTLGKNIRDAKIYISGLGQYDLFVNGKQVDNSVFKPLWSDYNKTIYYNVFDVSGLLNEGKNAIGVLLGNGMYNVSGDRYTKFRVSFGPPTLLLQAEINYIDGNREQIVSDNTWKYDLSPITFNCVFGGEDYDANMEQKGWNVPGFNDGLWKPVILQEAPGGKLTSQSAPPVKITEIYAVKEVREIASGKYLFDMGQNLSGFPSIKVKGKKGQKIRLVVGDVLNKDKNSINQGPSGSPYYLEYTLKGDKVEEWTPQFTYYGYQYMVVDGIDYKKQKKGSDKPVLIELKSNFIHLSAKKRR